MLCIPSELNVPWTWFARSVLIVLKPSAPEVSTLKKMASFSTSEELPLIPARSKAFLVNECSHLRHVHRNRFDPIFFPSVFALL